MRMSRPARRSLFLVVAAGSFVAWPIVASAQDAAKLAVLRPLVLDSLRGAGARTDQLTIAADSGSASLLRAAGLEVEAAARGDVFCPDGTGSDGRPVPAPVGYRVSVTLELDATGRNWVLGVGKSCTFSYHGRQRGFRESGRWELITRDGRWILGRSLGRSIT